MEGLLAFITAVCSRIQTVSDLFWDFPTNFEWYSGIPVLGNFSLAIILLIGSGIYFSANLRFRYTDQPSFFHLSLNSS